MNRLVSSFVASIVCAVSLSAQPWMRFQAPAWITVPDAPANDYGVYYFRKDVQLTNLPQTLVVNVTGDNRYKLLVNGQIVSIGPARSDLAHWNYETIDIRPYLHEGKNVVAAQVWNDGSMKPEANLSYRTGFLLWGDKLLNTDDSWLCITDKGYQMRMPHTPGYYAAGPDEQVDMRLAVGDWYADQCDLSHWQKAKMIATPQQYGTNAGFGSYPGWMLKSSTLPQRELTQERFAEVRKSTVKVGKGFLNGTSPLTIPANTETTLILDQHHLTNAYFSLLLSKGKDSQMTIGYAESLYGKGASKGNRNEIEGKRFWGRQDSIIANGKDNQQFTTMAWRTYRYMVLHVKTAQEPLVINDLYGTFTGYPFELKAKLETSSKELQQMMEIGWRTARLCAVETYMDCPYYEQLQYLGDTRIQALISLYNTGDDRLVKNFYNMADWSRTPEGTTQSRYPSDLAQYIQPYALHYIYSLHDYMMYGGDMDFLKDKLMGMRCILDYFRHYQKADGRLENLPGWNFTDWVSGWEGWRNGMGVAEPGEDGASSVLDLQLLYAYQLAADLEEHLGMRDYAKLYHKQAQQLLNSIRQCYWHPEKGLYSNRSDKPIYSQHANALAILTGVATGEQAARVAQLLETDATLAPASIYFKFYTHQAMVKAGLGDHYLSWLDKWRENIQMGLTTWGETSDVDATRSDCHAWGSSPNIEFFRTVLGIDSDAPAFQHIRIEPHLGEITKIGGEMPHPDGSVKVSYTRKGNVLTASVQLPAGTSGTLVWQGKTYELNSGNNNIKTN